MTWPPDPDAPTEPHVRAFFDDIADHPDDATVRFVFADWLEERDDPRAELLRLQGVGLRDGCGDTGERLWAWWKQYGAAWFGAGLVQPAAFDPVASGLKLWDDSADELLAGATLAGLRRALREGWVREFAIFDWTADQIARGGELGLYQGPSNLSFAFCAIGDGSLEWVRDCPRLRRFMTLGRRDTLTDAGLAPLGSLTALQHLNLCMLDHVTGDGLPVLAPLTQLRRLNLSECTALTDAGLAQLPPLPLLEELYFRDNAVLTGAGLRCLAGLPALQTLFVFRCPVFTSGLAHVGALPCLRELTLSECPITDAGMAHLANLKKLETLDVEGCTQVTGAGLAHLHGLTSLRTLKVRGAQWQSDAIAALGRARPECEIEWE